MEPQVRLLGGHELRTVEGVPVALPTRKSWALLGYLAQSGGRDVPREELAALLWPHSGEAQARASLRQELAVLRKGLDEAGLAAFTATKELVRFAIDADSVDTRRMERLIAEASLPALREAAQLFPGEFLAGLKVRSDGFEEWLWLERQRLKNLVLGGLLRLLREDEASGQSGQAIATASAILAVEPTQEQAHRALMRLYRRTHRRAEALRQFRHCADLLQRDLDTEPSQATRDLAAEIRREAGAEAAPVQPASRAAPPTAPERREIAVAVFALPDLPEIAERLDPEELSELQANFGAHVAEIAAENGGSAGATLGGQALALFGYPGADEHACERAVLAGLSGTARPLPVPGATGAMLAVGIAQGDTVVQPGVPAAVAGAPPILAQALSAAADKGTVRIAQTCAASVRARFLTEPVAGPGPAGHRVLRERLVQSRFDASKLTSTLTPFVGRADELAALEAAWARSGQGGLARVAILGEAGIGKSRLAHRFVERVLPSGPGVIQLSGAPLHRQSAFHPVIQGLERLLGLAPDSAPEDRVARLEAWALERGLDAEDVVPPLAALLATRRHRPGAEAPPLDTARVIAALSAGIAARARQAPLIVVIEDLHWLDAATGALLEHLVTTLSAAPVLMIATLRPGPRPAWIDAGAVQHIALGPLPESDARAMAASLLPAGFTRAGLDRLLERAEGVPLFIEELARAGADAGRPGRRRPAGSEGVPDALHASLLGRIDRLGPAREVLQAASVFGKTFDLPSLAEVTALDREVLIGHLDALQAADLVYRVGSGPFAQYEFKHVLVQELTYGTLMKAQRAALHRQVAEAMERAPGGVRTPELVAWHFAQGDASAEAARHYAAAGRQAARVAAHREAAGYFADALAQVILRPDGPERTAEELSVLCQLGPELIASEGFAAPRTGEAYERAFQLRQGGQGPDGPVLWGLWGHALAGGDVARAAALCGQAGGDPAARCMAGVLAAYRGENAASLALLDGQEGAPLERYGLDLPVVSMACSAWVLALSGRADEARAVAAAAVARADEIAHRASRALAAVGAGRAAAILGDGELVRVHAGAVAALTVGSDLRELSAEARLLQGRAMALAGEPDGLSEMQDGLAEYHASGAALVTPFAVAWIAEAEAAAGQRDAAGERIDDVLARTAESGLRCFEAELLRLRGALRAEDDPRGAEADLLQALDAARAGGANLVVLRAALDLADLLARRGSAEAGRALIDSALAAVPEESGLDEVARARAWRETPAMAPR